MLLLLLTTTTAADADAAVVNVVGALCCMQLKKVAFFSVRKTWKVKVFARYESIVKLFFILYFSYSYCWHCCSIVLFVYFFFLQKKRKGNKEWKGNQEQTKKVNICIYACMYARVKWKKNMSKNYSTSKFLCMQKFNYRTFDSEILELTILCHYFVQCTFSHKYV